MLLREHEPISSCAKICTSLQGAKTVDYKHQAAPGAAITGNGAILLFSHSSSEQRISERGPSQAMRAAGRDPAGGEIPVELIANSRLMTSYVSRGVGTKRLTVRNRSGNEAIHNRR